MCFYRSSGRISLIVFAVGSLSILSCAAVHAEDLEWEREVFYQIFVRSFHDSSGDGNGDLEGIRQKLDYLEDLGVTGILLSPLYPSEFYHNYFPKDFEGIDPDYGTMDDYFALIRDMRERGMKLIIDKEIHYVTEGHTWLDESLGNPDSEFGDYILYADEGNLEPEPGFLGMVTLPGHDGRSIRFATVNLENEEVREYMFELFRFWVDPHGTGDFKDGVDGFRLDHIMDDLDRRGRLTGLLRSFWRPLIGDLKQINPNLMFVGEQADWWYGADILEESGADAVFAFPVSRAIRKLDAHRLVHKMDSTLMLTPAGRYQFVFAENHDKDRLATVMEGNPQKMRAVAALILFLKGIPILYYGQEIGMQGRKHEWYSDGNDIPMREAMQWHSTVDGPGVALWYRETGPWWDVSTLRDHERISVEEQRDDPESLLDYYRRLISLRREVTALSSGDLRFVQAGAAGIVAFERSAEDSRVIVLLSTQDEPVQVTVAADMTSYPRNLLTGGVCAYHADHGLTLEAFEVVVCGE